jgi:hypothetical protein
MITNVVLNPELADAITDVINELASELDLHYEDADLVACAPTMEKMDRLVGMLQAAGYPVPQVYQHIIDRYHKSLH